LIGCWETMGVGEDFSSTLAPQAKQWASICFPS
jgi:hypothetical protein